MAVSTVRLDGTGDYTSITAALLVAVNPGDIVDVTQEGTYPNESWTVLAVVAPNVTIRNTSGGTVTVEDIAGRASYAAVLSGGAVLDGLTLSGTSSGAGTRFFDGRMGSNTLRNCQLVTRDTPAAGTDYWFHLATGSTINTEGCTAPLSTGSRRWRFAEDTGATGGIWNDTGGYYEIGTNSGTALYMSGSGAGGSFARTQCLGTGVALVRSFGVGTWAFSTCRALCVLKELGAAGATITIDDCRGRGAGLIGILAGTVASLTIRRSTDTVLVANLGTITAFAGSLNCYVSTAVGTTSADDRVVASSADFRYGGSSGLEPLAGSALLDAIPVGTDYGSSTIDLLGFPRLEGGRQTVGPVQARLPRSLPVWRKVA